MATFRMNYTPYLFLVMAGLIATSLFAQTPHKPIFISPEQLDVASVLPNPPANDSPQALAELAELHKMQQNRSPEQIAHAKHDDAEEDIFIF